ncbi:hypothetical protein NLJ89_g12374 [Agrocybe chaxingu]|uniref:Uncharacterized protein n=1 Tax=Agrocybe chaxingu TaxID=84603 RepID=A0A9W8MM77_9AGAR|nr:hypothetical protein NLJ89_g12374 [Agrocybe chaxingu]
MRHRARRLGVTPQMQLPIHEPPLAPSMPDVISILHALARRPPYGQLRVLDRVRKATTRASSPGDVRPDAPPQADDDRLGCSEQVERLHILASEL